MSRLLIKKNIELYGSDSASIDKLNDVAYYLRNSAHDTSLVYAYKALELSKKTNYIRGMAKSLFTISICNIYQANFSLALESAFQAYKYYEQIQDKEYMAFILNNIGYLYKEQKNYSAAFSYLLRAEKVFRELKNNSGIGLVLGNMGDVYNLQLDYEKALEAEFEALKHTHKLNDEYYRAVTLYHIRQNIELKHC